MAETVRKTLSSKASPRPLSRVKPRKKPLAKSQLEAVERAMQRDAERCEQSATSIETNEESETSGPLTATGDSVKSAQAEIRDAERNRRKKTDKNRTSARRENEAKLKQVKAHCRDCGHTVFYKTRSAFSVECSECRGTIHIKPGGNRWMVLTLVVVVGVLTTGAVVAAAAGF